MGRIGDYWKQKRNRGNRGYKVRRGEKEGRREQERKKLKQETRR